MAGFNCVCACVCVCVCVCIKHNSKARQLAKQQQNNGMKKQQNYVQVTPPIVPFAPIRSS